MEYARTIILSLVMAIAHLQAVGITADKHRSAILNSIFSYPDNIDTTQAHADTTSCAYIKYRLSTDRRNFILLAVPTMYAVAHGGERRHVGEAYDRVTLKRNRIASVTRVLQRTTIPHNRKTLPTLVKYLTPDLYAPTLIGNAMLSPFNRSNRKYYRYRMVSFFDGTTTITFRPKVKSTQLVSGTASIDTRTGRINTATISGEYDMIRFTLTLKMGSSGLASLVPRQCTLDAQFLFIGNKISARYESTYGMPQVLPDTVALSDDTLLFDKVRPYPLTPGDKQCFDAHYAKKRSARQDSTEHERGNTLFRKKLWETLGETLLGRIRSNFGNGGQGSVRIAPILNPLYFGYSGRRGLTYKFDVRMHYAFTPERRVYMRFKSGYSFKQRQFYFNIPASYYFSYSKNRYLEIEFGNGNRITNSQLADEIKGERGDSIDLDRLQLNYFRDMHLNLKLHYDLSPKIGFDAGFIFHRRTAVNHDAYTALGHTPHYVSAAPHVGIEYRPAGFSGPIISADYERSIKGFCKANIEYERYEFDAQYKRPLPSMSSLQLRAGTGFYSHKGDGSYFLDYTNFRENTIPGGWNDSWTNSFELLGSYWYNASKYYIRANLTYESPILVAAWIPFLGHYIEKERIYVNALNVTRLHPYLEYGYGIRTRLFSAGMFIGQRNWRFDGFGVKFGFELFRQW